VEVGRTPRGPAPTRVLTKPFFSDRLSGQSRHLCHIPY
jgi:hypothetical protein